MPDRRHAALLPAGLVLALWLALTPASGGYFPRDWYPAGLVACCLLAAVMIGARRVLPDGGWARALLGCFGALVALSMLSIAWAPAPGTAWESAGLLLTYGVTAWILALLPWRARPALVLLGAWSAGVAVICAAGLGSALAAEDLTRFFSESRWAEPVGYANGLAGLAATAAVPALVLCAHRALPAIAQGAALAVATFLVELSLLPQSRGAIIGLGLAVLAALWIAPHRWALLLRTCVVGVAVALAAGPLLDVYDVVRHGGIASAALEDAVRAMALTAALAGLAGAGLGLAARRIELGERGRRASRWGGAAVAAAIVLAVAGAAVANSERISDEARAQWDQLTDPGPDSLTADYYRRKRLNEQGEAVRLLSALPSERYDYLRVTARSFRARPVAGEGAGSFEDRYTSERRFPKYSRYPHNLGARVLGENGALGILALLGLVAAAVAGLWRGARGASGTEKTLAAAALATAASFFGHAQFDWVEAFPAITAPVLGFLVVALVVLARGDARAEAPRWAVAAGAVVVAVAAVSLALPYMAVRYRERALASWRADGPAAYRDLDRARGWNPIAASPSVTEGLIAVERREYARARDAFGEALEREEAWLPHFELALLAAAEGDRRAATRQLDAAGVLNPLEGAISAARREIRAGKTLDPAEFNRRLFDSPLFKVRRLT